MSITYDELKAAIEEVVAERPDFVYSTEGNGCQYVRNDEPSCLIGCALHRLGVSVEELKGFDLYDGSDARNLPVFGNTRSEVAIFAQAVQERQDGGFTWSESLREALESW